MVRRWDRSGVVLEVTYTARRWSQAGRETAKADGEGGERLSGAGDGGQGGS